MTTIDHAGLLTMSGAAGVSDEHVARRALQVARRTALGVLGDAETAADIAQEVAITAVRRAGSLRDPAALDAWLQAAAAIAAEQPAPAEDLKAYRYTRVLTRFVDLVQVDGEKDHMTWEQPSENWTADGFSGRTVAPQGTGSWETPPSERMQAADSGAAVVKPYDGSPASSSRRSVTAR